MEHTYCIISALPAETTGESVPVLPNKEKRYEARTKNKNERKHVKR